MSAERDLLIAQAVDGRTPNAKWWIRANCPLCEMIDGKADRKRSFGLHVLSGWFECYRCGSRGRLAEPLSEYADAVAEAGEAERRAPPIEGPPDGFYLLAEEPGYSSLALAPARDYLTGRGLDWETIERAQIGACTSGRYRGFVVIPVFDKHGAWVWYVGRKWVKKADRPYLYPLGDRGGVMFNEAALDVETEEPIIVVEGCFDALAYWPDGVAVLGKPTDAQVWRLAQAPRPVAFVLDGDAHEEGFALAMKARLDGARAGSVRLPPKVDPDEVDRAALRQAARAAVDEGEVLF